MDYKIKKANDLSGSLSNSNKKETNDLLKKDTQGYKTILDMQQKVLYTRQKMKIV